MKIAKSQLRKIIKEEIEKMQQLEADDRRLQREVQRRSPHRAAAMKRVRVPKVPARPVVGGSAVVNIQDEDALLQVLKGGGVSLACKINGVDIYAILDESSADSMEHKGIIKRRR